MNKGESRSRKRCQTNKDNQERRLLMKEPNMKRGEKSPETYNKDTEEAKSTKRKGKKRT